MAADHDMAAAPIQIEDRRTLSPHSALGRQSSARRPSLSRNSRSRTSFSAAGARPSSSMPAMEAIMTRSASGTHGSALDDEDDEDVDMPAEWDDEHGTRQRRGSGSKKAGKGEQFACEKCGKSYRHPACLTKHRWQHTEFWRETSKFMLSKHQSVQMLEAAAILINGQGLPEEKSLWPAAVSPPASGLLGSRSLNAEVLSRVRTGSSPLSGPALMPLEAGGKPRPAADDDTSSEASSGMDVDSRFDGDMFEFDEFGDAEAAGSAVSSEHGSSYKPQMPMAQPVLQPPRLSPYHAAHAAHQARMPAEFGVSAPQLGFFHAR